MRTKYIADSPDDLAQWLNRTLEESEFSVAMIGKDVKVYIRLPHWGQNYTGLFYTFKGKDLKAIKAALDKVNPVEETILMDLSNRERDEKAEVS